MSDTTLVCIKRQNGVVVQDCEVYIGRACYRGGWELPQSKWHNPYTVNKYGDKAITLYEEYIRNSPLINNIEELRGKVLGCWCIGKQRKCSKTNTVEIPVEIPKEIPMICHGQVLIKILNETNKPPLKLRIIH